MAKNTITVNKVLNSCDLINSSTDNIITNLNKIAQLIELMPNSFVDKDSVKTCEIIYSEKIILLKKYCEKCKNISRVLKKINDSYISVDNEFSNKQIIE